MERSQSDQSDSTGHFLPLLTHSRSQDREGISFSSQQALKWAWFSAQIFRKISPTNGTSPPGRMGSKGISPAVSEHSATAKRKKTQRVKSFKGICTAKAEFSKEPEQIQTQWEWGNLSFGLPGKSPQKGGPCEGKPRTYRTISEKKKISTSTCTLEAQKDDFPTWLVTAQRADQSLGHSASPFFISPGSSNANLLKCIFIAGSWRLVELRNLYSCTVVYRAALRHGIYYVWSFITTIYIRADGEHESNTAALLPTALCYRWQEMGERKTE